MKPAPIILRKMVNLTGNPKACVAGYRHAATNTNRNAPMFVWSEKHAENRAKLSDPHSILPPDIGDIGAPQSNPNITPGRKSP